MRTIQLCVSLPDSSFCVAVTPIDPQASGLKSCISSPATSHTLPLTLVPPLVFVLVPAERIYLNCLCVLLIQMWISEKKRSLSLLHASCTPSAELHRGKWTAVITNSLRTVLLGSGSGTQRGQGFPCKIDAICGTIKQLPMLTRHRP